MIEKNKINKNQDEEIIQKEIIKKIDSFVKNNDSELERHYFCIIDKKSLSEKRLTTSSIYENISEYDFNASLLKVSVVVLTANLFECEILNYNVYKDNNKKKIKKLDSGIVLFPQIGSRPVEAYILEINEYSVLHLKAPETGSNTPCGSADLVRHISTNNYIRPSTIISFGICYGIDYNNQSFGDTLIAEKVYPWSIGVKINDEGWSIKHDDYVINIREKATELYSKIHDVFKGKQDNNKKIKFSNVIFGNMLTGEAVVSNERIKIKAIENAHGCKIIGGEMEGYGLAKECIYYSNITCLIVKAICDWGACKNINEILPKYTKQKNGRDYKGQIQAYAAYKAYTVLKKIFFENIFCKNNIFEIVKNDIINEFYNDRYVQMNILKNQIKIIMSNNEIEYLKGSCSDEVINLLIYDLEKSNVLSKKVDEGIIGYSFI